MTSKVALVSDNTKRSRITVAETKKLNLSFKWTQDHDDAFVDVDPQMEIFGSRVLVQVRTPKRKTKGGIILTDDAKETEQWNTQVGLVRAVGPLAFCNRETMKPWVEGVWCQPGDFIRMPKYGGDRWQINTKDGEPALFVVFNDLDLTGKLLGDPLAVKAFI